MFSLNHDIICEDISLFAIKIVHHGTKYNLVSEFATIEIDK